MTLTSPAGGYYTSLLPFWGCAVGIPALQGSLRRCSKPGSNSPRSSASLRPGKGLPFLPWAPYSCRHLELLLCCTTPFVDSALYMPGVCLVPWSNGATAWRRRWLVRVVGARGRHSSLNDTRNSVHGSNGVPELSTRGDGLSRCRSPLGIPLPAPYSQLVPLTTILNLAQRRPPDLFLPPTVFNSRPRKARGTLGKCYLDVIKALGRRRPISLPLSTTLPSSIWVSCS